MAGYLVERNCPGEYQSPFFSTSVKIKRRGNFNSSKEVSYHLNTTIHIII